MNKSILACALLVLVVCSSSGCKDPVAKPILRTCWDGTQCDQDYECPAYAAPGVCGDFIVPTAQESKRPTGDAGSLRPRP